MMWDDTMRCDQIHLHSESASETGHLTCITVAPFVIQYENHKPQITAEKQ